MWRLKRSTEHFHSKSGKISTSQYHAIIMFVFIFSILWRGYCDHFSCIEVTLLQLKKKFGKGKSAKEFIASITKGSLVLCFVVESMSLSYNTFETALGSSGQKGIPHPQASMVSRFATLVLCTFCSSEGSTREGCNDVQGSGVCDGNWVHREHDHFRCHFTRMTTNDITINIYTICWLSPFSVSWRELFFITALR